MLRRKLWFVDTLYSKRHKHFALHDRHGNLRTCPSVETSTLHYNTTHSSCTRVKKGRRVEKIPSVFHYSVVVIRQHSANVIRHRNYKTAEPPPRLLARFSSDACGIYIYNPRP